MFLLLLSPSQKGPVDSPIHAWLHNMGMLWLPGGFAVAPSTSMEEGVVLSWVCQLTRSMFEAGREKQRQKMGAFWCAKSTEGNGEGNAARLSGLCFISG